MIKSLDKSEPNRPRRKPKWPIDGDNQQPLFTKRPPLRKMTVLIDAELLKPLKVRSGKTIKQNPEIVLAALLDHEYVQFYKYSENGPPSTEKPLEFEGHFKPPYPVYEGWAVIHEFDNGHWPVTIGHSPESYAVSGVSSNAPQVARNHATTAAEDVFAPEQREKDVLALHVASEAVQADIYITERPYLYADGKLASTPGVTVCTVKEAMTILGLYLRTQGEFVIPTGSKSFKFSFNRGLYFWVGTRELLPEAWRWFSACVQHSTKIGDDKLLLLGGSLLDRVARALQSRDDIHTALNLPTNNDNTDDALGSLDNVLVLLMGSVDVSARVAHYVLGLSPRQEYGAAWQKAAWLRQIRATAPNLALIVDPNTSGEHILTILRLLRNSVHGAALQGITVLENNKQEMLIGLPANDEADILMAMDAMGGRDSWGFRPLLPGRSHVDPAMLADRLFEEVVKLLNSLMKETPVESLAQVRVTAASKLPPKDKPDKGNFNTFSEWNRQAIRLQLGL